MVAKQNKSTRETQYLQLIGTRWYARVPVPNRLRPQLGPYLRRTLGTSDINEARKRRWAIVEWAQRQFAEEEAKVRPGRLTKAEQSYNAFRAKLREIGPQIVTDAAGNEMFNPTLDALVDRMEEQAVFAKHPELGEALGDHVKGRERVSETLKDYLADNPKRNATTVKNYEKTVALWIEKHGDRPLNDVTRAQAVEWLGELAEGRARETLKRYATVMGHLWEWLHRKEADPPQGPFKGILKRIGGKGRALEGHGFYDNEELQRAWAAVSGDAELRSVFLLALYGGFRLDECLRLQRQTLEDEEAREDGAPPVMVDCFVLEGGKTRAASRALPVHPRLHDIVPPTNAKASALSVRYGRLMRGIKMAEGKTFHSLRKSFTTALERVGCPQETAARLVGHSVRRLTYGVYSKGHGTVALRTWVEKMRFPI